MLSSDVVNLLEENGYKITKFRKYFIDILCSHDHKMLTAKNIKEILEDVYEYHASFDTIYKNLKLFLDLSVVHEKNINHEAHYLVSNTLKDHHHFLCLKCNGLYDINDYCPENTLKELYPEFEISGHSLEVYGICSKCKSED